MNALMAAQTLQLSELVRISTVQALQLSEIVRISTVQALQLLLEADHLVYARGALCSSSIASSNIASRVSLSSPRRSADMRFRKRVEIALDLLPSSASSAALGSDGGSRGNRRHPHA